MAALGSTPGIIVGVGVGAAASAALAPVVEPARQDAWNQHPTKRLPPATVAQLVAQGAVLLAAGEDEARHEGIDANRFDALVYLARKAPDLALTLELWRRGLFGDPRSADAVAMVDHALAKEQIEHQYWGAIKELFSARLSPPVAALAIVRGIMRDTGNFLPVGPPTRAGKVPAFPVSPLDPLEEARAWGYDADRLFVETAISGRPMGPESAAAAVFRDILERVDYDRAISEGDIRNEWADAIFETARQIPSVSDYINAHLRGWITEPEMNAGVARHGMSSDDAHLLYLRTGRPAAPGQMATAAARGIDGPDGKPMDRAQFLKGIAESDIRPEWGPMLWDSRFLYPPLFQLTRLVQGGAITPAVAADWATKDRYPPEVVTALTAYWQTLGGGEATDPRVKLATSQAIAALKKAFLREQMDEQGVTNGLEQVGVSATTADQILGLWILERLWTEKPLTPAVIKRAYRNGELALDEATARLVQQQWSAADANIYLTT